MFTRFHENGTLSSHVRISQLQFFFDNQQPRVNILQHQLLRTGVGGISEQKNLGSKSDSYGRGKIPYTLAPLNAVISQNVSNQSGR